MQRPVGARSRAGLACRVVRADYERRAVGEELLRRAGADVDDTVALSGAVSAEDRRTLAEQGHALPDGSYPIPDVAHLRAAARLAASHHGNWKAARSLIKRRAKELGVDLADLPGFSDDDSDGDSAETHPTHEHLSGVWSAAEMLALAGRGGGRRLLPSSDERTEIERLADEANRQPPGPGVRRSRHDHGGRRLGRNQRRVSTASRAHAEDEDIGDRRQPAKGGAVHPAVAALMSRHRDYFEPAPEQPQSASSSLAPKSPARRDAGTPRRPTLGRVTRTAAVGPGG